MINTKDKKQVENKSFAFSKKNLDDILQRLDLGQPIKMHEKPWYKNMPGIRKPYIKWQWTEEEQYEYYKCKTDIYYFAENYCFIKSEDGKIKKINLRDYQEDVLDLFQTNRAILMASRQTGKCKHLITKCLYRINGIEKELPMFKILFMYKENKTIYDYLKYPIYMLLSYINNL